MFVFDASPSFSTNLFLSLFCVLKGSFVVFVLSRLLIRGVILMTEKTKCAQTCEWSFSLSEMRFFEWWVLLNLLSYFLRIFGIKTINYDKTGNIFRNPRKYTMSFTLRPHGIFICKFFFSFVGKASWKWKRKRKNWPTSMIFLSLSLFIFFYNFQEKVIKIVNDQRAEIPTWYFHQASKN